MVHIHKYSKWEVVEEGQVISTIHGGMVGIYIIQEKTCEKCGKTKMRTVRNT